MSSTVEAGDGLRILARRGPGWKPSFQAQGVQTGMANISPSPGRRSVWTSSSQLRCDAGFLNAPVVAEQPEQVPLVPTAGEPRLVAQRSRLTSPMSTLSCSNRPLPRPGKSQLIPDVVGQQGIGPDAPSLDHARFFPESPPAAPQVPPRQTRRCRQHRLIPFDPHQVPVRGRLWPGTGPAPHRGRPWSAAAGRDRLEQWRLLPQHPGFVPLIRCRPLGQAQPHHGPARSPVPLTSSDCLAHLPSTEAFSSRSATMWATQPLNRSCETPARVREMVVAWGGWSLREPQGLLQSRPVHPGRGDVGHPADQAQQGQTQNGLKGMSDPSHPGIRHLLANRDSAPPYQHTSHLSSLPYLCKPPSPLCNRPGNSPRTIATSGKSGS